ncbi:alcohol dehydrogenase catalytic domain-containing protein [Rhodococcus sp. NPDC057529]|uniref:alcohol dehydrogenase catalytic domain-containing protein n=1 Tax=Rhodococcus sp. NPDC057529 TaxID=3346158 RepID=UPI00366DC1F7
MATPQTQSITGTNPLRSRALVHLGADKPLEEWIVDLEPPRRDEVLVTIVASGVCHSDLHARRGEWGITEPTVLGHEGAGIVERVGDGVTTLKPGDHVVLSWVAPCRRCRQCQVGRGWACTQQRTEEHLLADGTTRLSKDGKPIRQMLGLGTFSERVVVPESAAVRVSNDLPFDVGALIGCGVATGAGAVFNNARVQPGYSVAVLGCGGVGLSVVMAAAAAGAHPIIAVDLEFHRLQLAWQLGATHTVSSGQDTARVARAVRAAADGRRVEYVFDAVGRPETLDLMTEVLVAGGTGVVVGIGSSTPRVQIDPISGHRIIGCNYGASVPEVDFPRLEALYLAGRLPIDSLVTHRIALDGVEEALGAMERRERARSIIEFAGNHIPPSDEAYLP